MKKVKRGKFVDFHSLYSHLCGHQVNKVFNFSLAQNSDLPTVQVAPRTESSSKISDISAWLKTWTVYLELQSYYHPQALSALIRYQGIILRFSRQFHTRAWLLYDQMFRHKKAHGGELSWDNEDPRLYNEILKGQELSNSSALRNTVVNTRGGCFKCGLEGHIAKFCSSNKLDSRPCWKFNSKQGCPESNCSFSHVCGVCKGGHPRFRCSTQGS